MDKKKCQRCGELIDMPAWIIGWYCPKCDYRNTDDGGVVDIDFERQVEAARNAELWRIRMDAPKPYKRFGRRRR